MKTINKWFFITTLSFLGFNVQAGTLDVDLFNGFQAVDDYTNGGGFVSAAEYGPDATILGGYRDIAVNCISGCVDNPGTAGDVGTSMVVSGGTLKFNNDTGVDGRGEIVWDGLGSGGLGGFDLTGGGTYDQFELTTIFSDGGLGSTWSFQIYAEDQTGNWTLIELVASEINVPTVSFIPFAGFQACGFSDATVTVTCSGGITPVDLTDLDILRVTLNVTGTASIDLELDSIRAVPEPSAVALFGVGILALGLMVGLQRRKLAA